MSPELEKTGRRSLGLTDVVDRSYLLPELEKTGKRSLGLTGVVDRSYLLPELEKTGRRSLGYMEVKGTRTREKGKEIAELYLFRKRKTPSQTVTKTYPYHKT